jgi:hypothetical protein
MAAISKTDMKHKLILVDEKLGITNMADAIFLPENSVRNLHVCINLNLKHNIQSISEKPG